MSGLDDFFAKKDKKKSKKKFTTSDELAKKLDEKPIKKKERQPDSEKDEVQDEDEWKEVEEQTKDYSGLKIGQLTISEEDQMQVNLGLGYDVENDGPSDNSVGNNKDNAPWNKSDKPVVEEAKPVDTVAKLFVPSALKKKKGVAPDISSEEYFPTLGTNKPDPRIGAKGFESIKHGAKPQKQTLGSAPLSTENRFNSLTDS